MIFAYHGTTEEAVDGILRDGFKVGTYFTNHFDSAVRMGGPYVFGIVFDKEFAYWEWRNSEIIPPDRIAYVQRVEMENVIYRPEIERLVSGSKKIEPCPRCNGYGELGYPEDGQHLLPGGCSFKHDRHIETCPDCGGYGDLQHPILLENRRVQESEE